MEAIIMNKLKGDGGGEQRLQRQPFDVCKVFEKRISPLRLMKISMELKLVVYGIVRDSTSDFIITSPK